MVTYYFATIKATASIIFTILVTTEQAGDIYYILTTELFWFKAIVVWVRNGDLQDTINDIRINFR